MHIIHKIQLIKVSRVALYIESFLSPTFKEACYSQLDTDSYYDKITEIAIEVYEKIESEELFLDGSTIDDIISEYDLQEKFNIKI